MADDPEVTVHGGLRLRRGGSGDPLLLLLHGLGATGAVWRGAEEVLRAEWPGRWVAPDLPGHGRSDRLPAYSFGHLAAAVAHAARGAGWSRWRSPPAGSGCGWTPRARSA